MFSLPYLIIALIILIYFIPTVLAWDKHNFWSIFTLNLLLGWSFIGWVVALVWALSKDEQIVKLEQNEPNTFNPKTNISISDEIIKLNELKEKGILTDEEFNKEKKKLLEK